MKPVLRYQSRLLFRKSYKPNRITRIRPAARVILVVRPAPASSEHQDYEYATDRNRVCPDGHQAQSA
jgi:hypothetical protein